jgi:hypothetical protein
VAIFLKEYSIIHFITLIDPPIFCACPAIADKATADCQGLAVPFRQDSFALGRLEAGATSTFAQLGYEFMRTVDKSLSHRVRKPSL